MTDESIVARPDFVERSVELLRAGGAGLAFHLRAKGAGGAALLTALERLMKVAADGGSLVLVNDRMDVALAGGADGVQLGSDSFSVASVRPLLGPDRLIGISAHSDAEAEAAAAEGADFLLCGTLYASRSHPGREASGVEWLRAAAGTGVPVIGIGGVTPDRVPAVLDASAHGVAVIRAIWDAAEPVRALESFLAVLDDR